MKIMLNAATLRYDPLSYVTVLWLDGFIQENHFYAVMGQLFCDVLMNRDCKLCVGYILVVFLWLTDAHASILWLQI